MVVTTDSTEDDSDFEIDLVDARRAPTTTLAGWRSFVNAGPNDLELLPDERLTLLTEQQRAAYDEQRTGLTEACVSHILRETEDEALASKERVDAGEDFGTVATEESTDPSAATNAGDLGCSSLAQYDPAFAEGVMAATGLSYLATLTVMAVVFLARSPVEELLGLG